MKPLLPMICILALIIVIGSPKLATAQILKLNNLISTSNDIDVFEFLPLANSTVEVEEYVIENRFEQASFIIQIDEDQDHFSSIKSIIALSEGNSSEIIYENTGAYKNINPVGKQIFLGQTVAMFPNSNLLKKIGKGKYKIIIESLARGPKTFNPDGKIVHIFVKDISDIYSKDVKNLNGILKLRFLQTKPIKNKLNIKTAILEMKKFFYSYGIQIEDEWMQLPAVNKNTKSMYDYPPESLNFYFRNELNYFSLAGLLSGSINILLLAQTPDGYLGISTGAPGPLVNAFLTGGIILNSEKIEKEKLAGVLTHEILHYLGLHHLCDSNGNDSLPDTRRAPKYCYSDNIMAVGRGGDKEARFMTEWQKRVIFFNPLIKIVQ